MSLAFGEEIQDMKKTPSDFWKIQLRMWADQYACGLINKPGILGVVIGGSLARGQQCTSVRLHSN